MEINWLSGKIINWGNKLRLPGCSKMIRTLKLSQEAWMSWVAKGGEAVFGITCRVKPYNYKAYMWIHIPRSRGCFLEVRLAGRAYGCRHIWDWVPRRTAWMWASYGESNCWSRRSLLKGDASKHEYLGFFISPTSMFFFFVYQGSNLQMCQATNVPTCERPSRPTYFQVSLIIKD